ncbi:MAG TPA: class I SAM-dependent rRNA methyltransferase [Elusimicrobiota bacterium]|nr:class I SAM-dependent rRNA methyltransferase [Elusimicrobiota bacterium]
MDKKYNPSDKKTHVAKPRNMSGRPCVTLKPGEERRIQRGHLWVFSNEVAAVHGEVVPGGVVPFYTGRNDFLGVGYYNPDSLIAGRILSRQDVVLDEHFFENRLKRAMAYRAAVTADQSYRWVFGESDDLPGLVVDRYDDVCVVQSYCLGMDKLLPLALEAIKRLGPWKAIMVRNDSAARAFEKLEVMVRLEEGIIQTPHWFSQDGLQLAADLKAGQKTGYFFDQTDNRKIVGTFCRGKRVLDLFCHTGAFGLWAARAGCQSLTGVDSSEEALGLAKAIFDKNGLPVAPVFIKSDVEEFCNGSRDKYDVVVADPPRYAVNKRQLPVAMKAYIKLYALALNKVADQGFCALASCSQHVDRELFRQILSRAVQESGRRARLVLWGGQAKDHPVRLTMPETDYLKFALLQVNG